MENFTPINAAIGGILIGLPSTLFLWLNGRIAGISGIAGGLDSLDRKEVTWRLLFLTGLIGGVALYRTAGGTLQDIEIVSSIPVLIAAGLMTGLGTRMSNGCTSGHGICGLARLSPRSFVAVPIFLSIAVITFFLTRHVLGGL